MALLRELRLSGHVRDHALDWDSVHRRWRVEVHLSRRRVMWNWVRTTAAAWEQRTLAEARRR